MTVDLLARLAQLLDDHELRLALDDPLDRLIFVSRDQHIPVVLPYHPFLYGRSDLDRTDAGAAPAFTVKRNRSLHTVLLGTVFDPFVDTAEDLFVPGPPLGKVLRALAGPT
jgi:hypothetical protein